MTKVHVGELCGVRVVAVGTNSQCHGCVWETAKVCPTNQQEVAAGFDNCFSGHHYELAPPMTTEQQAKQIAQRINTELGRIDQTKHSAVLRILQSKLGQRRTAAIFKPT